ncbi:MBL fold metallo-hydrolase [Streptomyces sp. NPDC046942]|uniref:MBL fold metallo-hydrolase n=1 Tax=Streptomyces sp. NPDC046942 TaxID=3155137 RepID=UPI003401BCC3
MARGTGGPPIRDRQEALHHRAQPHRPDRSPREGLILVDARISWRQTHEHNDYYEGIARHFFDEDEYQLTHDEELPAASAALGLRVEDVRKVVATHLHEDHVSGLSYLPDAELVISRAAWDSRDWKLFGFLPMVYHPSTWRPAWPRAD